MKIIIVADKQAGKFLSNRMNLGFTKEHSVAYGDIIAGDIDDGPFVWVGGHWVVDTPQLLINSRQITRISETESLVSYLQDDDYNAVIIGCDPLLAITHLTPELKKVYASEDIKVIFPYLEEGLTDYRSLRDRIRNLINQTTVERVETDTEGTVNHRGKIIVVADKQASNFLSDHINLGETPERFVLSGDIIKGNYAQGRITWNGERWEDVPPALVVHNRQVNNKNQVEPLISSLVKAGHDNVIIGCDPYIAKKFLVPRLKVSFLNSNIHLLSPSLEDGREETLRLREDIQRILNPESAEKVRVVSEETDGIVGTGNDNPQEEARYLRVTLTNSADPKSAPSIIDVFFNEGDHLELDFRNTNQEASWKSL